MNLCDNLRNDGKSEYFIANYHLMAL